MCGIRYLVWLVSDIACRPLTSLRHWTLAKFRAIGSHDWGAIADRRDDVPDGARVKNKTVEKMRIANLITCGRHRIVHFYFVRLTGA